MSWQVHLPALVVSVPLLGAFISIAMVKPRLRNLWFATILVATTVLAFLMWRHVAINGTLVYVMGGERWNLTLPSGMTLPIRIIMEVDAFGAFMALAGSIATLASGLFSVRFLDRVNDGNKFVALFFLLFAGMLGLEVTGDFFNFFVFLEIASVASFGLIAFWRDRPEAIEASFKYAVLSTFVALIFLIGVGILYGVYGTLNMAAIAKNMQVGFLEKLALVLFIVSLAMKSGAVPLHMWEPDAYGQAPAGVSCFLVVVGQASLYGMFRIAFSVYGQAFEGNVLAWVIIVLGLLSMFIGVIMAVIQKEAKRLMAYHCISQTGYMLMGIGLGLLALSSSQAMSEYGFTAMKGGIFHIINNAMYKGLLFLTAGSLFYATGTTNLNKLGGLARKMPYTTFMFAVAAAAIAGLPPFNGFVSKLLIYESSFVVHPFLAVVAMVTSILTLASFVKVFQSGFLGPSRDDLNNVREVPLSMIVGMMVLCVMIISLSLMPNWALANLIEPAARDLVNQASYIQAVMGSGL
ncbi:proton-conducting transporter transmembrane domain-containing protein [Acetomicrobium hydrogeniformans]|uniref:Putative monovalent cation/H+ antiporter subunit D n=1 Tax=Acetomicrobium hydrogeniformans ATCC BAA-1850 TaxID=592015 RepID=A0A0T5X8B8_9BACT|nr:proton-conducting transporter membrane subunit [Acetomicrobium hydrogeniformans]KRT34600.1 putative monovalent cation/H+ antiporter subunit D [Acetomicrobium hydrogeniformans ATCC BAA-1850]